jgi:hypothetical protein
MQNERRDLQNRTKLFALSVIRIFAMIPKTTEAQVLGKQLLRSGTSVGANYREAYRARSKAEWSERAGDMDGNAARWRRASREKSESIYRKVWRFAARA